VRSGEWRKDIPDTAECYYRLYKFSDMHRLIAAYESMLCEHGSMKEYVRSHATTGIEAVSAICRYFAEHDASTVVPRNTQSACKRVCMFLRWMVRTESPVDLGLWADIIDRRTLIMPLDTHVVQEALRLGLLKSRTASMATAADLCPDGDAGYKAFMKTKYDICVLDVMMPKKDGFTLAQEIRQANTEVPIIFLTAKTMKEDILEGFKIGADDYITKPFSMEELVFRIEAILRRVRGKKNKESSVYHIGRFTFDTQKQLLVIGDKQTKLTTKENELLALLCSHANEILQRDFALKTIWIDDNYFNARSMDVYITKLRKHLKDDDQIEIINIHGKGYKLITPEEE
jgi:DNA-binding response OmpR family regulator